jgi:hypothetical protein
MPSTEPNRYARILVGVFEKFFTPGAMTVPFTRTNLKEVASELGVKDPDNWGDALYSYRFRYDLPAAISDKAPAGKEWAHRSPVVAADAGAAVDTMGANTARAATRASARRARRDRSMCSLLE